MNPRKTKVVHCWPSHSISSFIRTIMNYQLFRMQLVFLLIFCVWFFTSASALWVIPDPTYDSNSTSCYGLRHFPPSPVLRWSSVTQWIARSWQLASSNHSSLGVAWTDRTPSQIGSPHMCNDLVVGSVILTSPSNMVSFDRHRPGLATFAQVRWSSLLLYPHC